MNHEPLAVDRSHGEPTRVALTTLGCKLNFVEMEEMAEGFARGGCCIVPFGESADLTIVHTCTVTSRSDFKSRHLISRARQFSPGGQIVVTGCYAELDGDTLRGLPGVTKVIPRARLHALPQVLTEAPDNPDDLSDSDPWIVRRKTRLSRAFLKIQTGCNQRCTFCRVWQARGPAVSVPATRVMEQAGVFLAQGFEELVLTGVDMGSWGIDRGLGRSFCTLLEKILALPGHFRVRLSSLYPVDVDERLLDLVTTHPKLCRHLHLPVQSASPAVLRRMGRHVEPARLCELTWRLREASGQFGIGADIIAGFPGETGEDFAETCRFVENSALTYLHVFPFSTRPGTAAAGFDGQHSPETIKERAKLLRDLGAKRRAEYRAAHPGGEVEVLIERRRDRATGLLTGFTTDYLRVYAQGPDAWGGRLVSLRLARSLGVEDSVETQDVGAP
ncbi:tRNA (N(6)-L-threonylcarbamoyladenosine(37)-C(2))-methylthiotransferase MtaB [Candidatus Fermentibacteria bacterium]|nr:tRNA (N(6)-L-threonylcarbamoyladenosine(37)-C(2))-methylthiotransferase MtaB [Candidatus Fermentibacteria bacterium]